jgi:hypothetical protein
MFVRGEVDVDVEIVRHAPFDRSEKPEELYVAVARHAFMERFRGHYTSGKQPGATAPEI